MRVLFVTTSFLEKGKPASGGLPIYLYRVSKGLQSAGHAPIILTLSTSTKIEYYNGIKVYRIKAKTIFNSPSIYEKIIIYGLSLNCKINEIINKESIDIIQFTSLFGIAMFYRGRIPAVMRMSSYAKIAYGKYDSVNGIEKKILAFAEKTASQKVNGIFAPSKVVANAFSKDIQRKVYVIESPFPEEHLIYDERIYQRKLVNQKYILFFGTLLPLKGVLDIADCIPMILRNQRDLKFVFIGNNSSFQELDIKKEIITRCFAYKKNLIFINALGHEQLYPIIKHAECVLLPSHMENFSNACVEAMHLGKIIIATKGTSFEQLIVDNKSGLLALPENPVSLSKKIVQALSMSEEKKEAMEKAAMDRIKLLHPSVTIKKLLDFYLNVLNFNV